FENSLVVVTGFGRPSDATWEFSFYNTMATNKNAMIRYQVLDRCLRNRYKRYYIEDLVAACNEALLEYSEKEEPVKVRQVYKDLNFMEEKWGTISRIPDGRRKYFRWEDPSFSISQQPLNDEEIDKLKETIIMLNRFKGMPQFEWMEELLSQLEDRFSLKGQTKSVIGFEQNLDYTAVRYLSDLFNAIVNKQSLRIVYQKFDGSKRMWNIHPYYIKQYNNRWFLFGLNDERYTITNIPLDRIMEIQNIGIPFVESDINFEEYFDDVIGVTINDAPLETIVLKFAPERYPYVVSKPLHGTSKFPDPNNGIVEIKVIPNKELESLIFSFGNQVEVISPIWFREKIAQTARSMSDIYSTCAQ
ncbi:MAG: WYL domain-containing protein, partial [Muribaculum sp.]|nr:WYL domain-containing protein [Muribaculum sp.]